MLAQQDLRWALALVFEGAYTPPLLGLREDSLKQAFRRRARDTHPDRARVSGRSEQDLARDFRRLRHAYETLLGWLAQRPIASSAPLPTAARPRPQRPVPRPPRSTPRANSPAMDCSRLPRRPLLLAEFLHLSGLVSWRQRIQAIVWQRQQRPLIGALAEQWGYLQAAEVQGVLSHRLPGERFAEAALRMGWINRYQLFALLGQQKRLQQPIGTWFVDQGILSPMQLSAALQTVQAHNLRYAKPRWGSPNSSGL